MSIDAATFIIENLRLEAVPSLPGIALYAAHPGSRLSRLADRRDPDPPPPYWAYQWAGGLALAHHFSANADTVAGRRVLDLGAGSGLVAITAAKAGASVFAAEIDRNGETAITLNAAANGVAVSLIEVDLAGSPPADIDLIAAGDVFYNPEVAALMLPFLERCKAAGIDILIGDPDRRDLPLDRLEKIANYPVGDVGDARTSTDRTGSVYRLR